MSQNRTAIASAIGLTLLLGASASQAAYWTFNVRADFNAKLAELGLAPVVHDFDGLVAGPISVGIAYDDITFTSWSMADTGDTFSVVGSFPPPPYSSPNQIGTDNGSFDYQMLSGSSFTFSLPPSRALGLYALSADESYAGDYRLAFADATVDSNPDDGEFVSDNTYAYFLGIITDVGVYDSGIFSSPGAPDYYFTTDDFITAKVPAPTTVALFGLGLLMLVRRETRRRPA